MYLDAISREKLRKLCKFGRLFEADRLLQEKGTARFRKTHKWTPLFVTVDRGFHSLVEVLLRYEHEPWDLEKAYSGALRRRRNDLAAMILKSPWWTREIDPVEAICAGDVELVKSMILEGTNFTKAPIIRNAAMNNPARSEVGSIKRWNIPNHRRFDGYLWLISGSLRWGKQSLNLEGGSRCALCSRRGGTNSGHVQKRV